MDKNKIQSDFLEVIAIRIPDKTELVKKLMEILNVEKEGIYRRLRGETFFSFSEVAIIAESLGISLDQLLEIDVSMQRPFSLVLNNFINPSEADYEMCESYIRLLKVLRNDASTHAIETWNTLPIPIIYQYPYLTRFYYLKWDCMYHNYTKIKKFKEIEITNTYLQLQEETLEDTKRLPYSEYIFSPTLFGDFINDLYQYYLLGCLKKSELKQIQKELYLLTAYLEDISIKGIFEDTGCKVNIYISHTKVDLNQCYIESDTYNFAMIKVLSMSGISSIDGTKNNSIENWLSGQKRLSTPISQSGEIERIRFFTTQRNMIAGMSAFIR